MKITEAEVRYLMAIQKLRNSEVDLRRIPLAEEEKLHAQILQGDYQNIKLRPFSEMNEKMGMMAKDPLTHYVYMVVAFISSWSRAVIEKGVTADDAFDLSDALLYTLSDCTNLDEVHEVYQLAAVMFAKAVFDAKQRQPSYQVVRIQNYIIANIYRKITVKDIADYMQMSPNYLCRLFSQEMKISPHSYIQQQKIRISCDLLRHTQRPVSDIATYMGFQTQSHFSAVFRKWMGISPSDYRKEQYREIY